LLEECSVIIAAIDSDAELKTVAKELSDDLYVLLASGGSTH
jgi:hypothetical protein